MNALDWIAVWLLGGAGAVTRVTVDTLVVRAGGDSVAGTFVVNISGALLLGVVDGLALTGEASILVGTATIGAYTTFSTWMLQTLTLGTTGSARRAYLNVAASLLVGLGAVALGRQLGML